jgi:hypothetical protein
MTALVPQISVFVQNDSGMDIPPRSVVVVTSVEISPTGPGQESRAIHHVTKYTGQVGNVCVTGNVTIAAGNQGRAYSDSFLYVSIDPSVATPKVMEQWGPVPNKWTIGRGGMGFFCQGYASTGDTIVRAIFLRKDGYYLGKLTGSLNAGTMATPTSGTFNVWHPNPSSSPPGQGLIVSPNSALLGLTAYNYSASNSGSTGYDCIVQMLPTGLTFVSVGCAVS